MEQRYNQLNGEERAAIMRERKSVLLYITPRWYGYFPNIKPRPHQKPRCGFPLRGRVLKKSRRHRIVSDMMIA